MPTGPKEPGSRPRSRGFIASCIAGRTSIAWSRWVAGELAGGLYGLTIGGAFFGESMFFRVRDASKVALVALMERLRERGYTLIDTQWRTSHLMRLGALEIPRAEYQRRLDAALELDCTF